MCNLKSIILPVLAMAIAMSSFAGDPIYIPKSKFSAERTFAERFPDKRNLFLNYDLVVPKEKKKEFDECAYLKNKEIAGFILFPIGLGAMAGGGYMAYVGGRNIVNKSSVSFSGVDVGTSKKDVTLVGVGAATAFVGLVLAPVGLVMGISAASKRAYCKPVHTLRLGPTRNGLSVAYKF